MLQLNGGARVQEVDEPFSRAIICIELEAYSEPRALLPNQLSHLLKLYGSYVRTAEVIGASEGFVRQAVKPKGLSF